MKDTDALLWPTIAPPPRTIPRAAPNAAALEIPRVYGEPSGFLRTHCITVPAIPSPKPARIPQAILGRYRFQIRITSDASLAGLSLSIRILTMSGMGMEPTSNFRVVMAETIIIAANVTSAAVLLRLYLL